MRASQFAKNTGVAVSAVAMAALPVVGSKLPSTRLLWPPIGSVTVFAAPIATGLSAVLAALAYRLMRNDATKAKIGYYRAIALIIVLLSGSIYSYLLISYVKEVETPDNGIQYRTVGSERSELTKGLLPGASDAEILKIAGLADSDIEKMWTPASVERVRFELFISYLAALLSLNFLTSSMAEVKPQRKKSPSKPRK